MKFPLLNCPEVVPNFSALNPRIGRHKRKRAINSYVTVPTTADQARSSKPHRPNTCEHVPRSHDLLDKRETRNPTYWSCGITVILGCGSTSISGRAHG